MTKGAGNGILSLVFARSVSDEAISAEEAAKGLRDFRGIKYEIYRGFGHGRKVINAGALSGN